MDYNMNDNNKINHQKSIMHAKRQNDMEINVNRLNLNKQSKA